MMGGKREEGRGKREEKRGVFFLGFGGVCGEIFGKIEMGSRAVALLGFGGVCADSSCKIEMGESDEFF